MLSEFELSNFRCHKATHLEMRRWTLLYGSNGAGKSTILDGLNSVASFASNVDVSHIFPGGVFALEHQMNSSALGEVRFTLTVDLADRFASPERLKYEVVFELEGEERRTVASETLEVDTVAALSTTGQRSSQLTQQSCANTEAAHELIEVLRHARRFNLNADELRKKSSTHEFVDRVGYGLPSALWRLDSNVTRAIFTDFRELFRNVGSIDVVPVGSGDFAIEFNGLSGAYLSDGQALALGLLFLAHAPHGPQLLLLDEPEATLSPVVTKQLLGLLDKALAPGRQVVATTHSPYVVQWGIHNDWMVRQVRPGIGSRTWMEVLEAQGISASNLHNDTKPISVTNCCALLETYFAD